MKWKVLSIIKYVASSLVAITMTTVPLSVASAEKELVIAVPYGPVNNAPDPRAKKHGWLTSQIGITETLLKLDEKIHLAPHLAEEVKNLSPTKWQLTLKENRYIKRD